MLDDAVPVVDTQRRFNPKIKEVVRKEVIHLLDADVIYILFLIVNGSVQLIAYQDKVVLMWL